MYRVRWTFALLIGILAACSTPDAAIAPSRTFDAERTGLIIRPITTIAALLVKPSDLRALVATPLTLVRSESGEQRTRQVLVGKDGVEALRVELALDGSLRLIAKSGVGLESGALSESSAIARALHHLSQVGLTIPPGRPSVRRAAGRTLVLWTRLVNSVPVPGDGTRVVLNGAGELVGLAIEQSPLSQPPARIASSEAALGAAAALLPTGASISEKLELAWVHHDDAAGEAVGLRALRRLAWCIHGELRDGVIFELQLDAGSLQLIGRDGAP